LLGDGRERDSVVVGSIGGGVGTIEHLGQLAELAGQGAGQLRGRAAPVLGLVQGSAQSVGGPDAPESVGPEQVFQRGAEPPDGAMLARLGGDVQNEQMSRHDAPLEMVNRCILPGLYAKRFPYAPLNFVQRGKRRHNSMICKELRLYEIPKNISYNGVCTPA
jgi:hypothetical protein